MYESLVKLAFKSPLSLNIILLYSGGKNFQFLIICCEFEKIKELQRDSTY